MGEREGSLKTSRTPQSEWYKDEKLFKNSVQVQYIRKKDIGGVGRTLSRIMNEMATNFAVTVVVTLVSDHSRLLALSPAKRKPKNNMRVCHNRV